MGDAKEIRIEPIEARDAKRIVRSIHYSGTVVTKSSLHLGVFFRGRCCGAMQFGQAMFQAKMIGLVRGSTVHNFLELNRMAFSEALPRNSESRAIAVACALIRKHDERIKWLLSFADATRCGDGAIYRASGFLLTQIKRNETCRIDPASGRVMQKIGAHKRGLDHEFNRWEKVPGYQLRYIRFVDPSWRDRLAVDVLPFSAIADAGIGMYRGQHVDSSRAPRDDGGAPEALSERVPYQARGGGLASDPGAPIVSRRAPLCPPIRRG